MMQDPDTAENRGHPIVCGGGWKNGEHRLGQPRAMLFLLLSVLWLFPSLGALWLIQVDFPRWLESKGLVEALGMIKLEQWVAFTLLLAHGVFLWLAWHFRRHEKPQAIVVGDQPNPDRKTGSLY
jgi:hypothetical protein